MRCKAPACDRDAWAKGLCPAHLARLKTGVSLEYPIGGIPNPPRRECAVAGCGKPLWTAILCQGHRAKADKYGITAEQLSELEATTHCRISGRPLDKATRVIDHDPATGRVRGAIHRSTNVGMGLFNHDPAWLRAAAEYLEESS